MLIECIAQVDGMTGYEVSGLMLLSKAVHLAQYLKSSFGIKAGDVISICSENRIEFGVTIHATLFLGATVAPLNHSYVEGMLIEFILYQSIQFYIISLRFSPKI